jgi:hypothetical protein
MPFILTLMPFDNFLIKFLTGIQIFIKKNLTFQIFR